MLFIVYRNPVPEMVVLADSVQEHYSVGGKNRNSESPYCHRQSDAEVEITESGIYPLCQPLSTVVAERSGEVYPQRV